MRQSRKIKDKIVAYLRVSSFWFICLVYCGLIYVPVNFSIFKVKKSLLVLAFNSESIFSICTQDYSEILIISRTLGPWKLPNYFQVSQSSLQQASTITFIDKLEDNTENIFVVTLISLMWFDCGCTLVKFSIENIFVVTHISLIWFDCGRTLGKFSIHFQVNCTNDTDIRPTAFISLYS